MKGLYKFFISIAFFFAFPILLQAQNIYLEVREVDGRQSNKCDNDCNGNTLGFGYRFADPRIQIQFGIAYGSWQGTITANADDVGCDWIDGGSGTFAWNTTYNTYITTRINAYEDDNVVCTNADGNCGAFRNTNATNTNLYVNGTPCSINGHYETYFNSEGWPSSNICSSDGETHNYGARFKY